MSYDVSTVSFEFRFSGETAEKEASKFYEQLPTGQSVNELSKKVVGDGDAIYFVSTSFDFDATPEYVRAVLEVMAQYAPENVSD